MDKDPFKEYIKESEPDKRVKGYAWHTAIGLQAVDGLKTSEYLMRTAIRNIEGEITFEEADELLQSYYKENPARDASDRTEKADKNSLVRANYNDLKNGIHETTEYLEIFLRNLLLNENHPLHNRALHISGAFTEPEKVNIEGEKANIEKEKVNIEDVFTAKTASHIRKLSEKFGQKAVFGKSDVQSILGLGATRSSALLREMAEHGIIEPVSGHGKGKYRFRQQG